jgi:hypothetical protein
MEYHKGQTVLKKVFFGIQRAPDCVPEGTKGGYCMSRKVLFLCLVTMFAGLVSVNTARADTFGAATTLALSQCNTASLCGVGSISIAQGTDGPTTEFHVVITMLPGYGVFGSGAGNGAVGWNGTGLGSTDDIATAGFSNGSGGNFDGFGSFASSLEGPVGSDATSPVTFDIVCASTPCSVTDFAVHVRNNVTGVTGFDATPGAPPPSVPEPNSFSLLGTGLAGLVALAFSRRRFVNS